MPINRREFLTLTAAGVVNLPRHPDILSRHLIPTPVLCPPDVATVNAGPFLSRACQDANWTNGWSIVRPFFVRRADNPNDRTHYLFLLKTGTGQVQIHPLADNGRIGSKLHSTDWTAGWTDAAVFETPSGTYLLILRAAGLSSTNHRAHVYAMNGDGSIGAKVDTADWESGWTNAIPYATSSGNYLLLYRSGSAIGGMRARVHQINADGTIGDSALWSYAWDGVWTSLTPYVSAGRPHLLLVRKGTALANGIRARVHAIKPDGDIETASLQDYSWGDGWTIATTFEASSRLYLILYNEDGRVHVHAMRKDGKIGSRVAWFATGPSGDQDELTGMENGSLGYRKGPVPWTKGWTTIQAFVARDQHTYLLNLKSGNGTMHLHRVQPMDDVGPAVTHVDDTKATVWMGLVGGRLDERPAYTVQYRPDSGGGPWQSQAMELRYASHPPGSNGPEQDYYVAAVSSLAGLQPGRRYQYRVRAGAPPIKEGKFVTAPASGTRTNFRLLVASCMDLDLSTSQPAWDHALGLTPDFAILLGDTAYPNTTDRSMQWAEHLQQRAVPAFARFLEGVPVFGQWDDHDFGPNNATGLHLGSEDRDESRDTFRELFPNPLQPNTSGGTYYRIRWGLVDFFVLDGRYYAHRHNSNDGNLLLGDTQWSWLEQELQSSSAIFKVIASGITILEDEASEKWRNGYPAELRRLLSVIRPYDGVFMLSGDVHRCRVRHHDPPNIAGLPSVVGQPDPMLRYRLNEIVSSGIGKFNGKADSEYRLHAFAMLDFDLTADGEKVQVSFYDHDRNLRESETILLNSLGTQ